MAQAKYYVMLLLVTLIWGATPANGKLVVDALSPLLITGLRFLCIAVILFAWLFITGQKKAFHPDKRTMLILMVMGFLGVLVHNGLLFTGLKYTTATNTALIESIGPTVTTVLAFLFIGERLNKSGWLGILISCLGAVCIVTRGSLEVLLSLSFNIGDLIIIACEAAWSAYVIVSWFIQGRASTVEMTAWMGLWGAIMCFVVGLFTGGLTVGHIDLKAVFGFTYLTLASGVFAFVGWNWACAGVGASKAGSFIYIVPLTGAIIGTVLLGEHLALGQAIGALLIIGGVIVTVRAKVRIKTQTEQTKVQNPLEQYPELTEHYNKVRAKLSSEQNLLKEHADNLIKKEESVKEIEGEVVVHEKPHLQLNLGEGFVKKAPSDKSKRLRALILKRQGLNSRVHKKRS